MHPRSDPSIHIGHQQLAEQRRVICLLLYDCWTIFRWHESHGFYHFSDVQNGKFLHFCLYRFILRNQRRISGSFRIYLEHRKISIPSECLLGWARFSTKYRSSLWNNKRLLLQRTYRHDAFQSVILVGKGGD